MQVRSGRKALISCALLITFVSALVSPSFALFDKTRFVGDLGIAFFCFNHWVLKPYKEGKFEKGAPHRTATMLKGGAALLFAVNRVHRANEIAHKSKDAWLHKLAGSLDGMESSFSSVGANLKNGVFKPKEIDGINNTVGQVGSASAANGAPIKEVEVPVP